MVAGALLAPVGTVVLPAPPALEVEALDETDALLVLLAAALLDVEAAALLDVEAAALVDVEAPAPPG